MVVLLIILVLAAGITLLALLPRQQPNPYVLVVGLKRTGSAIVPEVIPAHLITPLLPLYGASGAGKSTILTSILYMVTAFPSHPGALVLDLKEDLCLRAAERLPSSRRDDILLVDFSDTAFPVGFNPLFGIKPERRTLAIFEIVSALMRVIGETGATAPRMVHVLMLAIASLVEYPGATLLHLPKLLTDPGFRESVLAHVTNRQVVEFWATEWKAIVGQKESLSNIQSLLNRLGLLKFPEVQHILGQNRTINLRESMDEGEILLVSMPQGLLGELAANLLAALFVAATQVAAQSRVELPYEQRRPFYIFADEFQNYDISSFDKLITEGRSMGMTTVTSCQYEEQISPSLRKAIQKNATVQLDCAKWLDPKLQLHHRVRRTFLQQPHDDPNRVLDLAALPPLPVRDPEQLAYVTARSRALLARPRAAVEAEIRRSLGFDQHQHAAAEPAIPAPVPQEVARRGHFFEDED